MHLSWGNWPVGDSVGVGHVGGIALPCQVQAKDWTEQLGCSREGSPQVLRAQRSPWLTVCLMATEHALALATFWFHGAKKRRMG